MYWRPQKVGSSTLLSLFASYGFRYNYLPKRKVGSSSFCRVIAELALQNSELNTYQLQYLQKYVSLKIPGYKSSSDVTQATKNSEALSIDIPFYISLNHELCAIQASLIRSNLLQAFRKAAKDDSYKPNKVLEVFQVREPLARAISVYYFWGELYKLRSKTNNVSRKTSITAPSTSSLSDNNPASETRSSKKTQSASTMDKNNWNSFQKVSNN